MFNSSKALLWWQISALGLSPKYKALPFIVMSLSFFIRIIIIYLCAILAIAFYTLLERKILGYAQLRKGPNKVGIAGLPQPFADALKLFIKEQTKPTLSNISPYILSPIITLILALLLWALYPHPYSSFFMPLGILFFISISRLNVYTTLGAGWASNSKYALLGALRRVAQTISYEVRIIFILLPIPIFTLSFDISIIKQTQATWPLFLCPLLLIIWFTSILAETNRTPFDFAEGESELVSGFNVEYRAGGFALIFMAEYANIIIIRLFTSIFFITLITPPILSLSILILTTTILSILFIWIRGTLPRIRYDRLISLTWKSFLPISLFLILIFTPLLTFFSLGSYLSIRLLI